MAQSQSLESLHSIYCLLTGFDVRFCFHERTWYEFQKAGFTENDLHSVIGFLRRENTRRDFKYSMRISKIIDDLAYFDELRAEAVAVARNMRPAMTSKEQVLQQWKPEVDEPPMPGNVIPIKEALKRAINDL